VCGLRTRLEEGRATVEADREAILEFVEREAGKRNKSLQEGLDHANATLHFILARIAWPIALTRGTVCNLDATRPGTLSLPKILTQAPTEVLHMNWGNLEMVQDTDLKALGEGLPLTLKELHLNFYSCQNITNDGVAMLVEFLPRGLQVLRLDFLGCVLITDMGVQHVACCLPESLLELRLDFATCPHITKAGVVALNSALPRGTKQFSATFVGTGVGRNFRSKAEMEKYCERYTHQRQSIVGSGVNGTGSTRSVLGTGSTRSVGRSGSRWGSSSSTMWRNASTLRRSASTLSPSDGQELTG